MPVALACLSFAAAAREAAASAAPRFVLDECAWHATHVVVATEGASIDGRFTVLESWVGALAKDEEIRVPRLATLAPLETRKARDGSHVTGARMVLFLKFDAQSRAWGSSSDGRAEEECVCWIEGAGAYAYQGGDGLAALGMTESAVREHVRRLRELKDSLAKVRATVNVEQRIARASAYVDVDSSLAVDEAFEILRGCGKAAVPYLVSLLRTEVLQRRGISLCATLGHIGDPSAEKPIVDLLERELVYWRQAKEKLQPEWWGWEVRDKLGREWGVLHDHASRVSDLLIALQGLGTSGCEDVVRRTQELWSSTPVLSDVPNVNVPQNCTSVFHALARRQQAAK